MSHVTFSLAGRGLMVDAAAMADERIRRSLRQSAGQAPAWVQVPDVTDRQMLAELEELAFGSPFLYIPDHLFNHRLLCRSATFQGARTRNVYIALRTKKGTYRSCFSALESYRRPASGGWQDTPVEHGLREIKNAASLAPVLRAANEHLARLGHLRRLQDGPVSFTRSAVVAGFVTHPREGPTR